ncbi:MAG: hypothetical protein ACMUIG_06970 [Thermoplasmatota archaeon]
MKNKKLTMFPPVILVLILSIPVVYVTLYQDFSDAREMADDVVDSTSIFKGTSGGKSISVTIIPDQVIDDNFDDTTEKVNLTNSTGGEQEIVQQTPKGAILTYVINAGLMVGVAIIAGFGIFFLFKYKKKNTLKIFFAVALGLCSSLSIMIYGYFMRAFLDGVFGIEVKLGTPYYLLIMLSGVIIGALITYNMIFKSLIPKRKNPALIAFSIFLGPFLAIVLPIWLVVFLLIGVSLWDLWAAKRGIIKKMVHLSEEHRKEERLEQKRSVSVSAAPPPAARSGQVQPSPPVMPASVRKPRKKLNLLRIESGEDITSYGLFEGKHYSLGIGDFIFFSLLASTSFTWFMLKIPWMDFYVPVLGEILALILTAMVISAILLGLKHTLGFLDRDSVMPGLPISILWGMIAFIGAVVFLQVLNLIFYGRPVNPI